MENDPVADERLEQGDADVLERNDVDIEVERERELGTKVEQIYAGGAHRNVDIGVGAGTPTGARAEEEDQVDVSSTGEDMAEAGGDVGR